MIDSKKSYFSLLLLAVISWSIVGSQKQSLPRFDAPIGIVNEHGCCYIAQWLQLMNAAYHAMPDVFQKVLANSRYSLLGSYAETLSNSLFGHPRSYRGFASQRHVLDPDIFVQSFVENSWKRSSNLVFEEHRLADGTVRTVNRGPWKKAAKSGTAIEVMGLFLEQWNSACREHGIVNPFESLLVTSDNKIISRNTISLAELCNVINTGESGITVVDTSRLLPPRACITQYPQVLIVVNSEFKPFPVPVTLQIDANDSNETIVYRLSAVGYAFPLFSADEGFVSNHGIAIVRYGDIWYLCDDDSIVPFINEQAAYNWIAKASEFTYSGPGLPLSGLTVIMPNIVLYIRDCSDKTADHKNH